MPTKAPPVGKGFDINRQLGPLPLWGWGAVAVGGWFVYTHFVKPATSQDSSGLGAGAAPGLSYASNAAPSDGGGGGGGGSGSGSGDKGDQPDKTTHQPKHKGGGGNIHNVIPPVGSKPPTSPKQAKVGRSSVSTFSAISKGSAGGGGTGPKPTQYSMPPAAHGRTKPQRLRDINVQHNVAPTYKPPPIANRQSTHRSGKPTKVSF